LNFGFFFFLDSIGSKSENLDSFFFMVEGLGMFPLLESTLDL
jgi:hypothetical protein